MLLHKWTGGHGNVQIEKAVICFSKAITLQPEQTRLHVSQAEAYLQLCDFQSAAACYKQARLLEPGAFSDRLAFIYYLQGQCLFDQGLFLDAVEAFRKAAEVKPGCSAYRIRSLACLTAAGHHSDCLKLLNDCIASDGPTSDYYIFRARLHKLLHQTSKCYQDVKLALALSPTCPNARAMLLQLQEASEYARQKAVDRALAGHLPEALNMINIALQNSPEDERLYLFRGTLYRRLKDFTAAIEDLVQAVELSEKQERECFSRGLYAEATLLLNKAIEEEKGQAGLYLNRGDCFFKQGDWSFALADYQQAEEMMQPNDPAVRLRSAVLHNTLGSFCFQDGRFSEAADMFSLAIQHNPEVSQYYENRLKASRKVSNLEQARQDLICMLILDSTNEEVLPLLMNLFPGCSVSNILSSPAGQAVRVQLMDTIQACRSSSSDQQKLTEQLQKMTLTNETTEPQAEESSEAEKELKLCVNQQEMQITLKSLLQLSSALTPAGYGSGFDLCTLSHASPHSTCHRHHHTEEPYQSACRQERSSYYSNIFEVF
ncbi:Tetratricopeptide repeat protein 16 [Collichthys lucidus]|uniref:Tetratricopeptide repeat protein 16 n=1 Tax=Collichthys lucidus TaxID=240159 RepID=A0A4U5UUD1_COLLU|nr:Tetratricopeptide repeat protein 16 [Collichthys lucidus]